MKHDQPHPHVELVCPAGTFPALRAAVDHGADAVYIGFRGATNARNFPGLNFSTDEARAGIAYAHERHTRVFIALNVYPMPRSWPAAIDAVDRAAALNADALILAERNGGAPTEVVESLDALAEGRTHTLGAYHRHWQ